MLPYQGLKLRHKLGVAANRKLRVDPLLDGCEPKVVKPRDLALSEPLVAKVGERGAASERNRFAQTFRRLPHVACRG